MQKRLNYIDVTKGIAIFVIVLGHTLVHSEHCSFIFKLLYSFNIPLFFIISGFTFNVENINFNSFFKKKFIRLIIPYFVWSIIFLIPYLLFGSKISNTLGTKSSFDMMEQIYNIIYGNGINNALKQNSSLWFLPALFSMEIIYYFIIKKIKNNKKNDLSILLFTFLIGFFTSMFLKIYLPFGINTTLNIGIYFFIGYLLKKYNLINKIIKFKSVVLFFIIGIFSFINNDIVSCIDYYYGNYLLSLCSGFGISFSIIFVSKFLSKNNILILLGKNTISILIFHKILILLFQTKFGFISNYLLNSNIYIEFFISIIISIISIFISLLIGKIILRIFPILLGNRKEFV